jgi:hypothetical protein
MKKEQRSQTPRLPNLPRRHLDEFKPRYDAARRIADRLLVTIHAMQPHPIAHQRLLSIWPTVLAMLESVHERCAAGARTDVQRSRRHGKPARPSTARARCLHQVHQSLVALELAVDSAVALAVTVLLDLDQAQVRQRRADLEDWLVALRSTLAELAGGERP